MRLVSLLIVAPFFAPLESLGAQQPGEPVRLTMGSAASSPRVAGTLVRHDADSFWVQLAGRTAPVSLARSAVVQLEVLAADESFPESAGENVARPLILGRCHATAGR